MGDSKAVFRSAFRALEVFLRDLRMSSFYRTDPRYLEDQPPFLNAAVYGRTLLEPRELLAALQEIESAHGRDRSREVFKGPRTLDIDILLYGNAILSYRDLVVPHPGLHERLFALVPLLELAPDLGDPRTGRLLSDLASELPDQGIYLEGQAGL